MALFLISYDLIRPEKDYPDLVKTLRNIGARRVLPSEWLVKSSMEVNDVFDRVWIGGNMNARDRLLVTQVSGWTASENVQMDGVESKPAQ